MTTKSDTSAVPIKKVAAKKNILNVVPSRKFGEPDISEIANFIMKDLRSG